MPFEGFKYVFQKNPITKILLYSMYLKKILETKPRIKFK